MVRFLLAMLVLLIAAPAAADPVVPTVGSGRIVDLGVLSSAYADPRRVVVWLPDGYSDNGAPLSVLYMHDGQNLFDKATAGYGMEWGIDETLGRLIAEKKVRPTIVVGIWNTPKRLQEYVPGKAFARFPPQTMDRVRALYGGEPLSDGYLKFIVRELKPLIDRRFHVRTGPADTAIMGSSMGALVSLYAIDEYPGVFGQAGMLSTHWPQFAARTKGEDLSVAEMETAATAFEAYLRPGLADPRRHRLYFDHGKETLDAGYAAYQARVERIVAQRGYRENGNVLTVSYPGQPHNELSWASRVEIPLRFLLGPPANRRR